jgi:predicted nuclease with TOPRIM domain
MKSRLDELQSEMDAGNQRLQELEREQVQLREVMLRISGAMQVLRELLGETDTASVAGQANGKVDAAPAGAGERDAASAPAAVGA